MTFPLTTSASDEPSERLASSLSTISTSSIGWSLVVPNQVVHEIAVEPDVICGAGHEDADRHTPGHIAAVPRDLEPVDRDVVLGVDLDHRGLFCRHLER